MQQRTKYSAIVFSVSIFVFLSLYQILLSFLDNEDGISVTLIASSSPFWAYFIDGYHIIYTLSWCASYVVFWLFSFSFLRPMKRKIHVKYKVYAIVYTVILYTIGVYMLSTLTTAEMPMRIIPCILAVVLFGTMYVIHRMNIR